MLEHGLWLSIGPAVTKVIVMRVVETGSRSLTDPRGAPLDQCRTKVSVVLTDCFGLVCSVTLMVIW